jgi:hypothetical protein
VAVVHCASPGTCTQSSVQCTPIEGSCPVPPPVCPPFVCPLIGLLNSGSLTASIASARTAGAFRSALGATLLT